MKTILVPTDFSALSENALAYACETGLKLNAGILLLHSYHIPLLASDIPIAPEAEALIRKTTLAQLRKLKKTFEGRYPGIYISPMANMSLAGDDIAFIAEKEKCDLIIMGTHGAEGAGEFFLGTNTASVIEKTNCPLIVVPEYTRFKAPKTVVFAANYGNHNFDHVHRIIDLVKPFNAEIILLHVSEGKLESTFEDLELERFKERIISESNYLHISYRLVYNDDVYEAINSFSEVAQPELIVLSMHHRSFLQKLFTRSLTKKNGLSLEDPIACPAHLKNEKPIN